MFYTYMIFIEKFIFLIFVQDNFRNDWTNVADIFTGVYAILLYYVADLITEGFT